MKLLRVFTGPMCAAKTTGALHVARRYARHGMNVVLVRPQSSRRDHEPEPGSLSTKNGELFPSYDIATASEIPNLAKSADVVWIDEPNHFRDEAKLVSIVPELRTSAIVLVSGLGATSELEPFGQCMPFLLATADRVHWMAADCDVCQTHDTATRSLYIGNAPKDGQLCVGGDESYRPVCPACWTSLSRLPLEERRRRFH